MLTFHNKKTLKTMMVKEIKRHQEQDKLIQCAYARNGKYCAVGCSIQSLNTKLGKSYSHGDHGVYETELGIPRIIARLEDRIFESLPKKDAMKWPLQFMQAIPVGADLSLVWPQFVVWLLTDKKNGVLQYAKKESTKKAIQDVSDLYTRVVKGKVVEQQEFKNAAYAAYAADAAAAVAAAYAAAAYVAAAYVAAAYAAAAYAAADAAADARQKFVKAMAKKMLQLLKDAPVKK